MSRRERVVIGCILLAVAAIGMPLAQLLAERPRLADTPRYLSDVVPPLIGYYVTRHGYDRPLLLREVERVREAIDGQTEVELLLALLQPGESFHVSTDGPLSIMQARDDHSGQEAAELILVAGRTTVLESGDILPAGAELLVGDSIVSGLLLNAGDAAVELVGESGENITLEAGGALVLKACQKACSTVCGPGYFACCKSNQNGCVSCPCVPEEASQICNEGGGPGATSCSTGMSSVPPGLQIIHE